MAPVHANEVDRAVDRARRPGSRRRSERKPVNSASVISPDAIANSRCLTLPRPRDVAIDFHVVRRVGEDHLRALAVEQPRVGLGAWSSRRRSADAARSARYRQGALLPDRVRRQARRQPGLAFGGVSRSRQNVDLGHLEAGDRDVEIKIEPGQVLQLDLEDLRIPAGLLGELVVGEDVGALLCVREMLEPQCTAQSRGRAASRPPRGRGRR